MKTQILNRTTLAAATFLLAASSISQAASGIWAGSGADGGWTTSANWLGNVVPGVTDGTTVNTDTALFTNSPTQATLTVDLNRSLQNFTFDTAGQLNNLTIGSAGAGLGNPLLLTSGGTALITSSLPVPASSHTSEHIFNAPLVLEGNGGNYTFLNNATSAINGGAAGVTFFLAGGVSGVSSAGNTTTLNLAGTQAGWDGIHPQSGNWITGPVSDGTSGGKVSLVKSGLGTWALSATNTYTGATVINGGLLDLNYQSVTALKSYAGPLVSLNTPLVFGGSGGTLREKIGNSVTDTNTFASVTLNAGQNVITIARTSSGSGYYNLGASITRSVGATLDVQKGGSGTYVVPSGTVNTLPLDSRGVAYLSAETFADWAGYSTTTNLTSGSYTKFSSTATSLVSNAVVASTVTLTTLTANTNLISLLDAINQSTTINLGGFTLTNGGTLISSVVATAGSGITNGTLVGPSAGSEVVILQNSAQPFTVSAVIADNGSASALTKGAAGNLTLTAANTYSGPTYINAGTLQLGNGGTSGSIANSSVVTNNGGLVFNRSDATTFATPIYGIGNLTNAGSGAVTLTANNGYSGNTVINSGATLNLGNGGATGSVSNSAAIINNGGFNVNLNSTFSFGGVIGGSGSLTNTGSGTIQLNGTNTYTGNTVVQSGTFALGANASISNSPNIIISAGAKLDVSAQTNFTLNGSLLPNSQTLSGSGKVNGSVNAAGASVVTMGTVGTYATLTIISNLTVSGATLNFDVSTSSKDQLVVGGNLNLQSGTLTVSLPSGTIPNGSYKLINYTNSLLGSVGNITVNFPGGTQVASLSSSTPNWITLVVSSANPNNLVWQGADPSNPQWWDVSTTGNWLNNNVTSVFSQHDNVLFDDTASTTTVDLQQSVSPGTVIVNASANNYTFQTSLAGKISGTTSLVLSNVNTTVTILTTNDYAGSTTIANPSGTLQVGNGSTGARLGSGNITNNGTLIYDSPDSQIVASPISGSGSLTVRAGTVIISANNSYTGNTTNASGTTLQLGLNGSAGTIGSGIMDNEGGLVINRSDSPVFNNTIEGAGSVTNIGTGTVTIGGANSYSGATLINNGVVKIGNPTALGSGLLTMNGGASSAGTLDLNGNNTTLGSLAGTTGSVLSQILNNGGTGVNTLTVNSPANATFAGLIADNSGSGGKVALVHLGPSTLTLNAANSYSGGTLESGGTLTLANNTAIGSGALTLSNGAVNINGGINNIINVASGTTNTLAGYNGQANFVLTNNGTLIINTPGSGTFTVLAAWPNFGGTISFGAAGDGIRLVAGSTGSANATWDLGQGVGGNVYTRDGGTIDLGALTGVSTTTLGGSSVDLPTTYRIGALNTSTVFSGTINNGATSALTTSINKVGSGTLTLDGALNYSGSTSVSGGTLAIGSVNNPNPSLDNSSSINISSNAVLDVSGRSDDTLNLGNSISQTLTANGTLNGKLVTAGSGAVIQMGNATNAMGTLNITGSADLEGSSTIFFKLNRTNSQTADLLAATNTITVNGGVLIITNAGPDLVTGDVFKLFNKGISGAGFTTISLPASNILNTVQYVFETNLVSSGSSPAGTIKVLQGVSALAGYSTNITATISGTTMTISWPSSHLGWLLEAQTNALSVGLSGNWVTNYGTANVTSTNFGINPNNGAVFYRLVHP